VQWLIALLQSARATSPTGVTPVCLASLLMRAGPLAAGAAGRALVILAGPWSRGAAGEAAFRIENAAVRRCLSRPEEAVLASGPSKRSRTGGRGPVGGLRPRLRMAARCGVTGGAGRSSDSSLGSATSGGWWCATSAMPATTSASFNSAASSSCSAGVYEMACSQFCSQSAFINQQPSSQPRATLPCTPTPESSPFGATFTQRFVGRKRDPRACRSVHSHHGIL
jgi:hypothetical protein